MPPTILALDFDGVLCDGTIEYFETSWRTYCQIWNPDSQTLPADLRSPSVRVSEAVRSTAQSRFTDLRPVIEVGWEMPILLRALLLGIPEEKIWQDWAGVAQHLLVTEQLNAADIGKLLDNIRDEWIATDLDSWLGLHRFYPGVVERLRELQTSEVQPVIITTKEGRFVCQLLQQQGIDLPSESIIGKESRRAKHLSLQELLATSADNPVSIWFVEDRLKTLQSVQEQPELEAVKLYLADWGYNTPAQRASVPDRGLIQLLSLSQFVQDFSVWP